MARFKEIGYQPQLFLLNSADCGVPQRRERVFFCALRNDISKPPLQLAPKHKWISVREATADLQVLTNQEIQETAPAPNDLKWWAKTKPGSDYGVAAMKETGKPTGFSTKKLDGNTPSNTFTATDMFKHWKICRKLTFREWKRIGSFPDDYHAKTDKIGKYMIGMSVPPKMTEQVARAIIEQWLKL